MRGKSLTYREPSFSYSGLRPSPTTVIDRRIRKARSASRRLAAHRSAQSQKAEISRRKAERRTQKAESRKQKAESREQLLTLDQRVASAYCLLPTAYCLLPTAYCLLPLPTAHWLLLPHRGFITLTIPGRSIT